MSYYHGTTKAYAEEILDSSLKASEFDVKEYLIFIIKNKSGRLAKGYEGNNKYNRVKWLGEGIYLFDYFNKSAAITWSNRYNSTPFSQCTALELELKVIPEENLFDLFSHDDIIRLNTTLDTKLEEFLVEQESLDREDLLHIIYIKLNILDALKELFVSEPYLGGVAVDLYNLIENKSVKFIRGIYRKNNSLSYYDVYYCLKDSSYINSIKPI